MTLDEHIEAVMDYFDFHKVKQVMEVLDWQWHSCAGIPEIADMRKAVRELMRDSYKYKEDECTSSTGGFEVYYYRPDDYFHVGFIVEDIVTNK
jgi:hypothetical protein